MKLLFYKLSVLASFFICLFLSAPALAKISINISQSQVLTFPTLGIPSSGSSYLSISPLNSSTSGTAQILWGTAARGQYALSTSGSGSNVSAITIDISGISSGNPNITLDNFQGYYNGTTITSFPSAALALPAASPGSTPLYLGARVTGNSSVQPGSYTGSFTITVLTQ